MVSFVFADSIFKRTNKQTTVSDLFLEKSLNSNPIRLILKKNTEITCDYHYNFHIGSVEQKLYNSKSKEGEELWEYPYSLGDRILVHISGHNFLIVCLRGARLGSECLGLLAAMLDMGCNCQNVCDGCF